MKLYKVLVPFAAARRSLLEGGFARSSESGFRYPLEPPSPALAPNPFSVLYRPSSVSHCLDLDEEAPLAENLAKGSRSYDDFKGNRT